MKCISGLLASAVICAATPATSWAARVESKGVGTYQYEGGMFSSSKPTDQEKAKALAAAKASAWKNFVAGLDSSQQRVIAAHETDVFANPDKFIIDLVTLDTYKDKENKRLEVVVRVAYNDEAVNQAVQSASAAGAGQPTANKDSVFTFLFMARKATSLRQFDARRTDVTKTESVVAVSADGGTSTTQASERGGSNLSKEDAVTFAVTSSRDLDSAMGDVLSSSGVDYVSYDDVVATCNGLPKSAFENEYVNSDELSPQTRMSIIKASQACDVRYLATGTVDTGLPAVDPVTGNQRIYVSVRAELWDINKDQKLPRKVGSVGPKQYAGLGPNAAVAARNALNSAAQETAKQLRDQLVAKGIR
jgi:hypothetical protein